jgi:hypothetical protein
MGAEVKRDKGLKNDWPCFILWELGVFILFGNEEDLRKIR